MEVYSKKGASFFTVAHHFCDTLCWEKVLRRKRFNAKFFEPSTKCKFKAFCIRKMYPQIDPKKHVSRYGYKVTLSTANVWFLWNVYSLTHIYSNSSILWSLGLTGVWYPAFTAPVVWDRCQSGKWESSTERTKLVTLTADPALWSLLHWCKSCMWTPACSVAL